MDKLYVWMKKKVYFHDKIIQSGGEQILFVWYVVVCSSPRGSIVMYVHTYSLVKLNWSAFEIPGQRVAKL